ncbi:outer membrane beta-barrel protein [uncultured Bacteroides sp.]|uniref:outer membrane beta-barrel protein n=1 Tax=uncultured Bacteroides sp. TaxID=162156 RepID=UPI00260A4289|nr:outer membrane beta-barrel protein [uncultured Bacteroides sp.]
MKKVLMTLFVMFAVVTAYAQEMYIGGGISLWSNTDSERTSFSISPDFGYEFNERWAFGGQLVLDVSGGEGLSSTAFAIAPYARFSYYENKIVRLFLDMGFGVSVNKVAHNDAKAGFELGVKPGIAVKLNDNFSFVSKVGFAGFRQDYRGFTSNNGFGVTADAENISIGIEYAF